MGLYVNSREKKLFYSCRKCDSTKNFDIAKKELMEQINSEFDSIKEDDFDKIFNELF